MANEPGLVQWLADPAAPLSLVCFHCAGGSAQSFFPWKKAAAGLCELYAVEMPGRARRLREPFAASVAALAEGFARQCRELPDKPLLLFGHSLGALLAYETARRLLTEGARRPLALLVSSRQSPDWLPVCAGLPELNDQALRDYLAELAGTPREVLQNKAMMDLAVPVLQADLLLILDYRHAHARPLEIPVWVFGAVDDRQVSYESLLAWQGVSGAGFGLRMIEGGHFAVMERVEGVFGVVRGYGSRDTL
ncbi:thioesterase II family protein [Pseudomonas sp. zfem002]|uniref:thioesterase II family protein n=1 Tax=Pseudomonas sp. zfem002 TaxID=3078197 RepID=UPI002927C1E3|nr:alpha/beta fold hydrolase [Pseudomonas sp. zfem002]MDU9392281.1 alpha/beta fold hydrolase [Pseudomonas sp. zfem002]